MLLIKANRDEILRPLQSVSGIVEKRHTLPILSNVLMERTADGLTLLATDIEIQIRTRTTAGESAGDAALTVGARKLQDILRSLPDSADVSLVMEDKKLAVRAGKSRFSLQTLPAADYPRMSASEGDGISLDITQKQFKRLLSLVQYAMAQQDIRYYLNGLLVVASGNELRVVATDGHRLATAVMPLAEPVATRTDVILPRKTVLELSRLLADSDDALNIRLTNNQALFTFGNIELVSKLIDGKFPDFERVIPANHPKLISIPSNELLPSLQRAAILTNEKFRGVRLVLSAGSLKLISTNTEQEEAQEELEVDYQGEALDIGFNITYLLDVLTHVSGDTVELRLNDSNSSALISIAGNEGFKYVVMPMRI